MWIIHNRSEDQVLAFCHPLSTLSWPSLRLIKKSLWLKHGFFHLEWILLTSGSTVRLFYVVVKLYFLWIRSCVSVTGAPWLWWKVWSDHSLSLPLCLFTLKFCFCLPFPAFSSLQCWMLFLYNYVSISALPAKNSPLIACCFHPDITRGNFTTLQDVKLLCLWDLSHVIWDRILQQIWNCYMMFLPISGGYNVLVKAGYQYEQCCFPANMFFRGAKCVFALHNCVCHHFVCTFICRCCLRCHVDDFNEQVTEINMADDRTSRNNASTVSDQQQKTLKRRLQLNQPNRTYVF